MKPPTWQLDFPHARLQHDAISANVNVERPEDGVSNVEPFLTSSADTRLLQALPSPPDAAGHGPTDTFARAEDLVATYPETSTRSFAFQTYWRAVVDGSKSPATAGLELILSAHTGLLDAHPRIESRSIVTADEVLRLDHADSGTFLPVELSDARLLKKTGTGCFLIRTKDTAFSYVEMVHPSDFQGSTVGVAGVASDMVSLTHTLIDRWMEKGVIVRARVRGMFVPREQDLDHAATCYQNFCNSQLPLTV